MKFRVYDNQGKRYPKCQDNYFVCSDGNLAYFDGKVYLNCDPDRYTVEFCLLIIDGKEMFDGDIISVDGRHPKILGSDDFGFYLENVEDIKHRKWMETKQRPSPIWFKEFSREFEIIGRIHEAK